ncbi:formylglycine-generating enzyme family protein [Gimesia panareensis]|uniref:formylglycine-generating enzyme family protein n=1 Tax=Gimesia panareensis TaxID=2527978 RepID=UPI00118C2492|nr:formylglycine-generating enzyme family protein [Gimesia panareensis]QDU52520.1 Serine/threonine-protein kinase pkn1 [Gimesia panareensis]
MTHQKSFPPFVRRQVCWFSVLAVILSSFSLPVAAEQEPSAEEVKKERLRLLKLFVDELVPITPGKGKFPQSFQMGSSKGEPSEQPVHEVTLTQDFWIAKYEVPQNLYEAIMGHNPSRWKGPRNSVEMLNWDAANDFCEKLTLQLRKHQLIGQEELIRLPTEAEWEYCCRAGTSTAYSFGDTAQKSGDEGKQAKILDEYAWHTGNAAGNDPPVGALKPNPWGLYDMHGYLWEFVADPWHDNYKNAPSDGNVWKEDVQNPGRIARGGSWQDRYDRLRSAFRAKVSPATVSPALGLRCVKAKIAKVKKSEN